ncbi:glycerol-3-phosphate 1-O-acyltransferase PlsY [Betaproteobacteria bacterium SCN2]|jgi:glycerol-3-phosphate acyltransferase PlsY|nr:glycerol-3-phosphate 1-O-acyltransferase PlsY [Betaproteobacteria bacterium SCN2]
MQSLIPALMIALGAYLIGSLSFAVIVARAMGLPDPRTFGSGNPGATNVLRTGKKAAAALTLLGDAAKGWLAVWLAGIVGAHFGAQILAVHLAAIAVFLGHLFPVFFGFKGGKGVATALGIMLALDPWMGLAVFATWLIVFVVSRISSLSALTAAVLAPVYGAYFTASRATVITLCVLTVLLLWRHRANIQRLLAGEEGRFAKPKQ